MFINLAIEAGLIGGITSIGMYAAYRIGKSIFTPGEKNIYLNTAKGFIESAIGGAAVGFFGYLMLNNLCFLRHVGLIVGSTYLSIASVETSHQIPKKEETTVTLTLETTEDVNDEGNRVVTVVETVVEETTQVAA